MFKLKSDQGPASRPAKWPNARSADGRCFRSSPQVVASRPPASRPSASRPSESHGNASRTLQAQQTTVYALCHGKLWRINVRGAAMKLSGFHLLPLTCTPPSQPDSMTRIPRLVDRSPDRPFICLVASRRGKGGGKVAMPESYGTCRAVSWMSCAAGCLVAGRLHRLKRASFFVGAVWSVALGGSKRQRQKPSRSCGVWGKEGAFRAALYSRRGSPWQMSFRLSPGGYCVVEESTVQARPMSGARDRRTGSSRLASGDGCQPACLPVESGY